MRGKSKSVVEVMIRFAEYWKAHPEEAAQNMQSREAALAWVAGKVMQKRLEKLRDGHTRLMTHTMTVDECPVAFDSTKPASLS